MPKKAAATIDMEADAKEQVIDLAQLSKVVHQYASLETKAGKLAAQLADVNAEMTALKEKVIPEMMGTLDLCKLDDGTKIAVKDELYPAIAEQDKPAAFGWLREHGFGSIIKNEVKATFGKGEEELAAKLVAYANGEGMLVTRKESVHPSTLAAFVKEQFADGKDVTSAISVHRVRKATIKFN